MMKIAFDARCLEEKHISGVGEYALELLNNLIKIESRNRYIIFSNSFKHKNNQHFKELKNYAHVELKRFSFPNKILNFFFWYLNWPKIDKLLGRANVFFAPNINFLSVSKDCHLFATFHDLSFERFPEFFALKTRSWHRYFVNPRRIARQAQNIVSVSESTKKDLEEIYGIKPGKIKTIYHGIRDDFKLIDKDDPRLIEVKKKYHLPENFILYLGNIEPRKNIESIIIAYENAIAENRGTAKYKLVLAGNVSPLCHDLIEKNKDIVTCGYIAREDRPYLYNLALLFVYPSFFEGFGLPVIESMACGTPVITSHNSSIPEVAENAAILIDPNRPGQISEVMQSLITDEKLYNKIREKGIEQAKKFSWKKCAGETLNLILSSRTCLPADRLDAGSS